MLIYFAFSLIALLGFCGLALDVGRMEARSLQLQTAADNAAISYALEYGRRGNVPSSNFTAMATAELAAYAAANNLPTPTVTLQAGASSGPFAGNNDVIQATVQQTMPTMMLGLLSSSSQSIQVSRTAVAAMPPCTTFYTTLAVSHSNLVLNCTVAVGTSLTTDSHSVITGAHMLIAGPAGASSIAGVVTPAPIFNWPSETHPTSYLSFPSVSGCQATDLNLHHSTVTLSPGFYCNSTTFDNMVITLQPGFYYMQGGISITNSTVSGGPVTMSMIKNSSNAGQFILSGSAWNVSAPTTPDSSGTYAIVLSCAVPAGSPNNWGPGDVQITHNSTLKANGLISCGLAGATISDSAVGDAGRFFSVTFGEATIDNSTFTITNDYSQLPGGSPQAFTVNVVQ